MQLIKDCLRALSCYARRMWRLGLVLLALVGGGCAHGPASYSADDAALSLAPELGPLRAAPPDGPGVLRIVTYNVHFGADVAGIAANFTQDAVLRTTDLLLVQEIQSYPQEGRSRAAKLAEALAMSYAYAPARTTRREGNSAGTHGVALLSRYPIVAATILPLRPLRIGGSVERRVALIAVVVVAGKLVRIYNVHLDTRLNAGERLEQLHSVVLAAQRGGSGPAVIGGDFNSNSLYWVGRTVPLFYANQPRALDAAMRAAGFDTPTAAIGRTLTSPLLRMRLDGLYTTGLAASGTGVRRSVKSSDHLPVWADFRWPP